MPGHRLIRDDWDDKGPDPYEVPVMGELESYEIHDLLMKGGVDAFAFKSGQFCNGPECVDCGKTACWHHDPLWVLEPCPARLGS